MTKRLFLGTLTILILVFGLSCNWIPIVDTSKGTVFRVRVEATEGKNEEITERAAVVFMNRLNAYGINSETKVSNESKNEINVKVFGKTDSKTIRKLLSTGSDLSFAKVVSPPNPSPVQFYPTQKAALESTTNLESQNYRVYEYLERQSVEKQDDMTPKKWVVIKNPPILKGDGLSNASPVSVNGKDYQISFSLKPDSAKTFGVWTGSNIGNYMGVVLNGKVQSIAFIRSQIFDHGQIDGEFTKEQAENLALILRSGYLPATLTIVEEKTFGKDSG